MSPSPSGVGALTQRAGRVGAKRWEWHRPAHFCTTARGYERVLERVCDRAGVPEPVYQAVDQLQPNNCYLQQLEVTVVATDSTPEGANHGTFGSEKVGETGRGNHSTPGVSGSHDITSLATRSLRTRSYLRDTPITPGDGLIGSTLTLDIPGASRTYAISSGTEVLAGSPSCPSRSNQS